MQTVYFLYHVGLFESLLVLFIGTSNVVGLKYFEIFLLISGLCGSEIYFESAEN